MYSYSSRPSWIMAEDSNGNRVWINLSKIDYAVENNTGWTMLLIGDIKLLINISFDKFGKILTGGADK
ncbi:hypothetical protein [Levilactobacillus yiduensis]|uniref:hypothetical protein n=1 Tax=Levilactobacillus yiduensis TaxID=2953880 RepID=UPI002157A6FB|nr:hypothetical protein [Levilactobacillus yiduensis]